MGVIRFTQKDLERDKPFDPGWKRCKVTANIEKMSKNKESINNVVTFEFDVEGEPRTYDHYFNEKANFSAKPYIEACVKAPVEVDVDYDMNAFVGCELFVEFSKEIYKNPANPNDRGRPINKAINFASLDNPPF